MTHIWRFYLEKGIPYLEHIEEKLYVVARRTLYLYGFQ